MPSMQFILLEIVLLSKCIIVTYSYLSARYSYTVPFCCSAHLKHMILTFSKLVKTCQNLVDDSFDLSLIMNHSCYVHLLTEQQLCPSVSSVWRRLVSTKEFVSLFFPSAPRSTWTAPRSLSPSPPSSSHR